MPWPWVLSSVTVASQIYDGLFGCRVVTLNCGRTTDEHYMIGGAVLSHDPDVVFLKELWATNVCVLIPLRMYYCCASAVTGEGRGMAVLSHRTMWPYGVQPSVSVLLDV